MVFQEGIMFFLILFIHLLHLTVAQHPHKCINSGNFTQNSPYQANLNTLLSNLASNVNRTGFYQSSSVGENSNRVNGVVMCRGDILLETCRACITKATHDIEQHYCPFYKEAILWFNYQCFLRYSSNSIMGTMTVSPGIILYATANASSLTEFRQELRILLDGLREQAANGGPLLKFATGRRNAPDFQTIYALLQCFPGLSVNDCSQCLYTAFQWMPTQTQGGLVLLPSCTHRYETYPFFNEFISEAEPPSLDTGRNTTNSQAGELPLGPSTSDKGENKYDSQTRTIILILVFSLSGILMVIFGICYCIMKRKPKLIDRKIEATGDISTVESLQNNFIIIKAATNYFSDVNKLGQGGFGVLYKGELPNGQKIAVKRLSRGSAQGDLEFTNEVMLMAKLQHKNLVRLIGFCLEGSERLLIYELMPNASLDDLLFDPGKAANLDWYRRYEIIGGIAKGLLYLHEDSRLRIIHRDLKASNVLLDEEMNPKISDFGMARLFVQDETHGNTNRIVGTYGYMAPEYVRNGQFSVKSDVFSFGVLVLEIISGKKCNYSTDGEYVENLSSYAWKNWRNGTSKNLIDPALQPRSRSMHDIMRCIHIALLCVQASVSDRPTMAYILLMINSVSLTLPVPSKPAFLVHDRVESYISKHSQENKLRISESILFPDANHVPSSINDASITELYPR